MTKIESEYKEMMDDVQMSGSMIAYCMKAKALELESELTAAREELKTAIGQRDAIEESRVMTSNIYIKTAEQRDRLAEVLRNIMAYRKGEKPHDYWRLPFEERENAAFDVWMQIENSINQALQSLTPNEP
jgi:hypothetical protein